MIFCRNKINAFLGRGILLTFDLQIHLLLMLLLLLLLLLLLWEKLPSIPPPIDIFPDEDANYSYSVASEYSVGECVESLLKLA